MPSLSFRQTSSSTIWTVPPGPASPWSVLSHPSSPSPSTITWRGGARLTGVVYSGSSMARNKRPSAYCLSAVTINWNQTVVTPQSTSTKRDISKAKQGFHEQQNYYQVTSVLAVIFRILEFNNCQVSCLLDTHLKNELSRHKIHTYRHV